MRIEQLQYFVEVAQTKSFSHAADRLHISQPSISMAISNLEHELGVTLFERSRSGVKLTDTGKILAKKAQEILNNIEDFKSEARNESQLLSGKLTISAIPSICITFLPKALSAFKKKFPKVNIELKEEGTNKIIKEVSLGNVDIGIVSSSYKEIEQIDYLYFESLISGKVVACVGKNSNLSFHNPISPKILFKHPIVIFNKEYRMYQFVQRLLREYGEPNILFVSGNTETTKKVIAEGIAIGFYTDLALKVDPYIQTGEIIPLEITDNNIEVSFGWIRSKNQHFSRQAKEFIKLLKITISEQVTITT